jgi:hypothetical protein
VLAALTVIPNYGPADWEHWNNIGMATFAATGDKLFKMAHQACPGWTKPSQQQRAIEAALPAMSILSQSACPAPALPLAVFGPFWSGWIKQAAEGANAPPDYVALPLAAVASSLLGNARWVVAWQGWPEPPALWLASVGNPSSGKSSGASPVTRDVLALIEKHPAKDYPRDVEQWTEVPALPEP